MRDIIKSRVNDPTRIEQECAKTRQGAVKLGLELGPMINRVVALWKQGQHAEALEVARFTEIHNPKNPDAGCLLGRAYMKITPPNPGKADIALRKANRLGCERPELFGLWAQAKQLLEDWVGLVEVTRLADKVFPSSDNLLMRAQAFATLGETAEQSGHLAKAAEYFRDGGRDIATAFRKGGVHSRVPELKEIRSALMFNYVRLVDRMNPSPGDNLEVWLAFLDAFECFVRRPLLVRTGVARLTTWWDAVRRREKSDVKAGELMKVQLGKLESVWQTLRDQQAPDQELLAEVERAKAVLQSSWGDYRRTMPGAA